MRILNLYAGIGGNRKLWGDDHEITAVEYDEPTAEVYKHYFPNDKVIIADAHQFLLENFRDFDFIWSSPPCPTHSKLRTTRAGHGEFVFPDMKLYEEIILLKNFCKAKWVVENVVPYYEPLIPAKKVDRHLYWSNFKIGDFEPFNKPKIEFATVPVLSEIYGFENFNFSLNGKNNTLKVLRNCVHPETGKHILDCALNIAPKKVIGSLFDENYTEL